MRPAPAAAAPAAAAADSYGMRRRPRARYTRRAETRGVEGESSSHSWSEREGAYKVDLIVSMNRARCAGNDTMRRDTRDAREHRHGAPAARDGARRRAPLLVSRVPLVHSTADSPGAPQSGTRPRARLRLRNGREPGAPFRLRRRVRLRPVRRRLAPRAGVGPPPGRARVRHRRAVSNRAFRSRDLVRRPVLARIPRRAEGRPGDVSADTPRR